MSERQDVKQRRFRAVYLFWLLPGPLMYVLYRLSFDVPQVVEKVYSRSVFRVVNQSLSTLTGVFPLSLGELLLYAFVLFIAIFVIVMAVKVVKAKKDWWKLLLKRLFALICVFSFVYALFIGLWGFNYARQPLGVSLGLDTSPASVDELYQTAEALAEKATALRETVSEDEHGVYVYSKKTAMKKTEEIYNMAAEETGFEFLGGSFGRTKPVLYSVGLSHAHITGVYFPFTAEANVNDDVPCLFFASAALHEAAHQRGFAREDEANFLAYYSALYSGDAAIEYSSTMLALIHTMNKLYNEDDELYYEIREGYSDGMERDLAANREYWSNFEGKASEVSEKVNNSYLKSNMQSDGVKSYGRMVDLLIGLWRAG